MLTFESNYLVNLVNIYEKELDNLNCRNVYLNNNEIQFVKLGEGVLGISSLINYTNYKVYYKIYNLPYVNFHTFILCQKIIG